MTHRIASGQTGVFIGIDVGGSKVRALVADETARIVAEATEPTDDDVVSQITRIVSGLGAGRVEGVGVGVPGAVDPGSGAITKVPNVPALDGVRLAELLRARLGVPVAVDNDLAAAALAELRLGADHGEFVAVVAAGTGIGLGLIRRGEVVRGATGAAGEIADIPLAGGVLEDSVSVAGLCAAYREAGGDPRHGTREILAAAGADADAARIAVDRYAEALAHGIHVAIAVLDPDRVVLSGGLGTHPAVLAAVDRHLSEDCRARVTPSELGADLPAYGAMLLGWDASGRSPSRQVVVDALVRTSS